MCLVLLNTWTSINGDEVLVRHPWPQPAPAVPGGAARGCLCARPRPTAGNRAQMQHFKTLP